MTRTRALGAGLLIAMLALAGCSTASTDSGSPDYAGEPGAVDADHGDSGGMRGADPVANPDTQYQPPPQENHQSPTAREVITTARVDMVVADPAAGAQGIVALADQYGGRVDQRSIQALQVRDGGDDIPSSARMTVRVPAEELEAFLSGLEGIGEVAAIDQSAEDVTHVGRDLDARIRALEASIDRLIGIMADASDASDLMLAEEALSQRQSDLESLQSQRRSLSDQVALSTVHLNLRAPEARPVVEPGGFIGGLKTGWDSVVTFISGVLVLTGVMLPWLILLGIPALVLFWVVRRRRRASTAKGDPGGDASPPAEPAVAAQGG